MSFNNSSCILFNGNIAMCQTIITLKRITSSISLIGCIFMITIIWLFRKYKVTSQRLILYLSIAALFNAVGFIIGDMTPDGPVCKFEGIWLNYFNWVVLMWICCITFNLYQNVIRNRQTETFEKYYHLLCWILPSLVVSLLPLVDDVYGPAGAWCWIKHDKIIWRFAIWYVPVFIIIVVLTIIYIYIIYCKYKGMRAYQGNRNPNNDRIQSSIKKDINTLIFYPFIYLVLYLFLLIVRIHNAFTDEGNDLFALWILAVLTAPLQGAGNAIAFGLDSETRNKLSWNQVRLACVNRFRSSVIQEYPTVADDNSDDNHVQRQASLHSQDSYNS